MAQPSEAAHGRSRVSSKQFETTKEKLRNIWHRADSVTKNEAKKFDKEAFISAATEANVADPDHAADMVMYAAHASQIPIKRSGQSAFSWIPLVTVAAAMQNLAAVDKRAAFLPAILKALADVAAATEGAEAADARNAPADLEEGAEDIDDLLTNIRKARPTPASRMGLAAKGMGRPKSISDAADALSTTVATLQASAGSEEEAAAVSAMEGKLKGLFAVLEAARELRSRATEALQAADPGEEDGTPLHAALQAVYSYQGPNLAAELEALDSSIKQGEEVFSQATSALQESGVDTAALVTVIAEERKELIASRAERPRRERGRRKGRAGHNAAAGAADASSIEGEGERADTDDVDAPDASTRAENGSRASSGRQRRPRGPGRGRRGPGRRSRGSGAAGAEPDFTTVREAASEDEEDAAAAAAFATTTAAEPSGRGRNAAMASPRPQLQAPPGFEGPPAAFATAAVAAAPAEGGGRADGEDGEGRRRRRKRGGRRGRGRGQPAKDAAEGQEANGVQPEGRAGKDQSHSEAEGSPRLRVGAPHRGPRRNPRPVRGSAAESAEGAAAEPSEVAKSGAGTAAAAAAAQPEQATKVQATSSRGQASAADESRDSVQTFTNPMFADDAEAAETVEQSHNKPAQEDSQQGRHKKTSPRELARMVAGIKTDLCDPITRAPLKDPVTAADGFTYERSSVEAHLNNSNKSPVSGETLSSTTLYPSLLVKSLLVRMASME